MRLPQRNWGLFPTRRCRMNLTALRKLPVLDETWSAERRP